MANELALAPHNINVEGFKMICQTSKDDLLEWLTAQMTEYYGKQNVVATEEYLFCAGNQKMMLVSHLDTVHKKLPSKIVETATTLKSPQGIGGDDRCGVMAILTILKEIGPESRPYLLFTTDEETGMSSTKKAADDLMQRIAAVNYIIELDRHGKDDAVFYECGNDVFIKWILSFGFKEKEGTGSDIKVLSDKWDLASANLSIGYESEHTVDETVYPHRMRETIDKVKKIIAETNPDVLFPLVKKKQYGSYYSSNQYGEAFKVGDYVTALKNGIGFVYGRDGRVVLRYYDFVYGEKFKVVGMDYLDLFLEPTKGEKVRFNADKRSFSKSWA